MLKSGKILRAMTSDGSARVLVTDTTAIVERARELHALSPMGTVVLGRVLTATSLIGSLMAEKTESVTLGIQGDGPAGKLLAVSDYYGNVRGYMEHPQVELTLKPNGHPDVGAAVGQGILYMAHDTGTGEPQTGMIDLKTGEIAEDIAAYYAESEQIPTVLSLGVLLDGEAHTRVAGGVLIQLLPFADEKTVGQLEENAAHLGNITGMLAEGKTLFDLMNLALDKIPYDLYDEITTDYLCTCSRERMKRGICSLGRKQVLDLLDEEEKEGRARSLTAECRFCETKYSFSEEELLAGISEISKKTEETEEKDGN